MQPFIGTNDLSDLLGTDVTTDDLATIAIDSACEIVRGYIDNQINLVEDDIITLDGSGTYRLALPRPPVRSVLLIASEDEDTLAETTDWVLESIRTGMVRRIDRYWPRGFGNITVTYSHGWWIEEPDDPEYEPEGFERVPSDIRRVALEVSKRMFQFAAVPAGVNSQQIGNYSYTLTGSGETAQGFTGLMPLEATVLDRYLAPALA